MFALALMMTACASPRPTSVIDNHVVAPPRITHRVEPEFPSEIIGEVDTDIVVEAIIENNGNVSTVRLLRGDTRFEEVSLAAVRQWRFAPGLMDGKPVKVIYSLTIHFHRP